MGEISGALSLVTLPATRPRFFTSTSPWNLRDDPAWKPDPNDAAFIDNLGAATGRGLYVNGLPDWPDYGLPIVPAESSTPLVPVASTYGWWQSYSAPIPSWARPSIGSDHHLLVHDTSRDRLWEFWELVRDSSGRWRAGGAGQWPAHGDGWSDRLAGIAARAYGGSATGGLILKAEMDAGVIPHCLAMAYPTVRGDAYARGQVAGGPPCIATHCDGFTDAAHTASGCIPEGARLRLKASVDIALLSGGRRDARVLLTALRDYGAYMVDHAGAATLYAEIRPDWGSVLSDTCMQALRARHLEVLTLPALTRH